MKFATKDYLIIVISTLICVGAGFAYISSVKPVYEVFAKATILRSKLASPDFEDESNKNRWIWVKDGLTTQQELVTDDFLIDMSGKNEVLKSRFEKFKKNSANKAVSEEDLLGEFARIVGKAIKVDYSGGDSSSYELRVRDPDRKFAKELAILLLERLRDLAIIAQSGTFSKGMKSIAAEMTQLKVQGISPPSGAPVNVQQERFEHYQTLKRAYGRLLVAKSIYSAESNERFQIISKPFSPRYPVWPNKKLILLAMALGGFFLGLSIIYGSRLLGQR